MYNNISEYFGFYYIFYEINAALWSWEMTFKNINKKKILSTPHFWAAYSSKK